MYKWDRKEDRRKKNWAHIREDGWKDVEINRIWDVDSTVTTEEATRESTLIRNHLATFRHSLGSLWTNTSRKSRTNLLPTSLMPPSENILIAEIWQPLRSANFSWKEAQRDRLSRFNLKCFLQEKRNIETETYVCHLLPPNSHFPLRASITNTVQRRRYLLYSQPDFYQSCSIMQTAAAVDGNRVEFTDRISGNLKGKKSHKKSARVVHDNQFDPSHRPSRNDREDKNFLSTKNQYPLAGKKKEFSLHMPKERSAFNFNRLSLHKAPSIDEEVVDGTIPLPLLSVGARDNSTRLPPISAWYGTSKERNESIAVCTVSSLPPSLCLLALKGPPSGG